MKHSDQVTNALKSLHPDVRRDIRRALDDVAAGRKRDTKALKPPLDGFHRLRVGKYRVIYRRHPDSGILFAEFLETRSSIYDNFQPPDVIPVDSPTQKMADPTASAWKRAKK